MSDYTIVDVPARWVVGTRDTIHVTEMANFYDRVYGDAADRITNVGGTISGPAVAYYFSPVIDRVDLFAGFPTSEHVAAKASTSVQFPLVTAARYVHRGSYDDLGETWKHFVEDLVADGYSIVQHPCWEEYVTQPTPGTPVDELVTELFCPVTK